MKKYEKPVMEVINLGDANVVTASCTGVDNVVVGCPSDTGCFTDGCANDCGLNLCSSHTCSSDRPR